MSQRALPPEFLKTMAELERSYLESDDPIRASGFGGGPERWRREREPILEAVDRDGDFLDTCCANGYLLECLVGWARERGVTLTPHGLDLGEGLVALARERLPEHSANIHQGNAWDWAPDRRFDYVYTLLDIVPEDYLPEFIDRLELNVVAPGGRLILGSYGSRSRGHEPSDVRALLESTGRSPAGSSAGGEPPIASFAWVDTTEAGVLSEERGGVR